MGTSRVAAGCNDSHSSSLLSVEGDAIGRSRENRVAAEEKTTAEEEGSSEEQKDLK